MAKWSSRTKFDEATKAVEQAPRKIYNAFPNEAMRRALEHYESCAMGGPWNEWNRGDVHRGVLQNWMSDGWNWGIGVAKPLGILINGRQGTTATAGSFALPAGTQAAETYVKYGIFVGPGTAGTVLAGNESTASTGAYLPDCPSDYVCVGYFEYCAGTSNWNRDDNLCTGQSGSSGTGTFYDLIHAAA